VSLTEECAGVIPAVLRDGLTHPLTEGRRGARPPGSDQPTPNPDINYSSAKDEK